MKKTTLIKLHLYCGLFTSFYILAFGVSSLVMNHSIQLENEQGKKPMTTWQDQVSIPPGMDDRPMADSVRDQLDIIGYVPYWKFSKDADTFNFEVTQLTKTTYVTLSYSDGKVEVSEVLNGFWAIVHGLHFFNGKIPNAPLFVRIWMVYQWLSLLVLGFSLILGLWLWVKYNHKTWELYAFGGIFIFSIIVMLLL